MKGILFDFGGTIDTDGVHWSEKYWELYQRFGAERSQTDVAKAFVESERRMTGDGALRTATMRETIKKQLDIQFSILQMEGKDALHASLLDQCYREVQQTIAQAKLVLERLQSAYALGVVSNFYGNLELVLKEFGLEKLFSTAVDSEVVGARKPDPTIFMFALSNLHLLARETYVVGDSYERDILPSKQLGCQTIWLKGKSWKESSTTTAADFTVSKFNEITKILL